MKPSEKSYNRIVIKIGSSILHTDTASPESLAYPASGLTQQVSELIASGKEIIIVSSGAIALGMSVLKMKFRPRQLSSLQAVAAVGQHLLMSQYRSFFAKEGLNCAQVLLTRDDFANRQRYLNAKNTLLELLKLGVVPIINENDTISTDEIKFGDNDRLSALVATLINAGLLIILSDVDGLLDKEKKVIRVVEGITPAIKSLVRPTAKKTCVGGMVTKIEAAKIAVDSGIPCVVANGRAKDILLSVAREPAAAGTLFIPKKARRAKEHWLAFGAKPKGNITLDDGAKDALLAKKSLLAVGVIAVEGDFKAGDIVGIRDKAACEFAKGKVRLSSLELEKVMGRRAPKEVAHRDNIVIL